MRWSATLSCRLPIRLRRWRTQLADQTGSGAVRCAWRRHHSNDSVGLRPFRRRSSPATAHRSRAPRAAPARVVQPTAVSRPTGRWLPQGIDVMEMPAKPVDDARPLRYRSLAMGQAKSRISRSGPTRRAVGRCGSRRAACATARASMGSDLPKVRAESRVCTISFGGTRTIVSPAPSSSRSSRRERWQQSSTAQSGVPETPRRSLLVLVALKSVPACPEGLPLFRSRSGPIHPRGPVHCSCLELRTVPAHLQE